MGLHKELRHTLPQVDLAPQTIGQHAIKHDIKSALLSGRHIILVGPPGIGKTTLVKQITDILPEKGEEQAPFVRVQGSPDLTAEDLLGDIDPIKALEFGPLSEQAFTKGKIFKANKGVLFFDEINRCPQKLQNALLQVLEERKATIGSYDVDFDAEFVLIATMNPQDDSTEELSSVFLDRFDLIYVGYPDSLDTETEIVTRHGKKVEGVTIDKDLVEYIVKLVRGLRDSDKLVRFPSVRATLGLYERAQANAVLDDKKEVDMHHVKQAVHSVLDHRIELKPSLKYAQSSAEFLDAFMQAAQSVGSSADDGP